MARARKTFGRYRKMRPIKKYRPLGQHQSAKTRRVWEEK
jgi:hypothetical protein